MNDEAVADALDHALDLALGPRGVLRGDDIGERYCCDVLGNRGEMPRAVLRPRNTAEVSAALRLCHAEGACVVTQGGRTGLALGQLPRAGEIVLSLERMTDIEAVDADSGTATVQAGVVLQALQERVAPLGLMFPLDLGGRGSCTIGGNIATNAGGNRVIRHGMTRELVLDLEAVLADGTVLGDPKTIVKNNTGPDLKQLFIGSEGIYGVVTRAVLRLVPKPAGSVVALCGVRGFDEVRALLRHLRSRLGGELTAFEVLWRSYLDHAAELGERAPFAAPHQFHVLVEGSGPDSARLQQGFENALQDALSEGIVDDVVVAQSEADSLRLWRVRDLAIEVSRRIDPIVPFDVSIAIGDMQDFTEALDAAARRIDPRCEVIVFGHVGDGNLHLAVHQPPDRPETFEAIERAVYALVGRYRGSVSAEHGIGWLKRDFLAHSRGPAEIETMRRLKAVLDPRGILNRHRIFTH